MNENYVYYYFYTKNTLDEMRAKIEVINDNKKFACPIFVPSLREIVGDCFTEAPKKHLRFHTMTSK